MTEENNEVPFVDLEYAKVDSEKQRLFSLLEYCDAEDAHDVEVRYMKTKIKLQEMTVAHNKQWLEELKEELKNFKK